MGSIFGFVFSEILLLPLRVIGKDDSALQGNEEVLSTSNARG